MKSSEFRLEELLALVGSSPLESATSEVLALAEAVWYQGYRPTQADLDSLARSVEPQSFKGVRSPMVRKRTLRPFVQLRWLFQRPQLPI